MVEGDIRGRRSVYCVTGATGYIGSWLVSKLLERGCIVHATFRNAGKASRLLSSWKGGDSLKLFQADLREEGSFEDAVKDCDGVFHVAASMEFDVDARENVESYVQTHIIDPAIKGTLNLLKSCRNSASVKRVVFTSSVSTLTAKDASVVDESCKNHIDLVWRTKPCGWVYVLSKLLTEETAFRFAKENGIDLISVIATTVGGPFLTPTVPSSIQILLSPLTGESRFMSILSSVSDRMGSIALVHVEDISNAHIFLMEQPNAKGEYICCVGNPILSELTALLLQELPQPNSPGSYGLGQQQVQGSNGPVISSKKLKDLGFEYKHGIKDIVHQTIEECLKFGFLHWSPKQIKSDMRC